MLVWLMEFKKVVNPSTYQVVVVPDRYELRYRLSTLKLSVTRRTLRLLTQFIIPGE